MRVIFRVSLLVTFCLISLLSTAQVKGVRVIVCGDRSFNAQAKGTITKTNDLDTLFCYPGTLSVTFPEEDVCNSGKVIVTIDLEADNFFANDVLTLNGLTNVHFEDGSEAILDTIYDDPMRSLRASLVADEDGRVQIEFTRDPSQPSTIILRNVNDGAGHTITIPACTGVIFNGDGDAVDNCDVVGGTITTASGLTDYTICAGDGRPNPMDVRVNGAVGSFGIWVVTDEDANILALQTSSRFDFEGAGVGTCLIWHLSYEDDLTGAEIGANAADLGGCFELSNPVTVDRVDCNDVCHTPYNIRIKPERNNRATIRWDRVATAVGYDVEFGYADLPNSFVTIPTRTRKIKVTVSPDRGDLEVRVRARCKGGETSDYSDAATYSVGISSTILSQSRSEEKSALIASELSIVLSPNPVEDLLTVSLSELLRNTSMVVFDGTGKAIVNQVLQSEVTQVDVSHWLSGVYMTSLYRNGERIASKKFIKI